MAGVSVTFIGGPECGDVGQTTMGRPDVEIVFPLNKTVIVDPETAKNQPQRDFLTQVIAKLRTNRFFKVEDVKEAPPPPPAPPKK